MTLKINQSMRKPPGFRTFTRKPRHFLGKTTLGGGLKLGTLLRICLELDLSHPRVQQVEVALDIAKQLRLIGRLRVVVLAVLEVHRDWSCKPDFFQVGKECFEINHALAQRTKLRLPFVAACSCPDKVLKSQHLNTGCRGQQVKPTSPTTQASLNCGMGHVKV